MKQIFRTVATILLCTALAIPVTDAQSRGRGRYNGGGGGTHQPAGPSHRPGNSGNPTSARPGNHGNRPGGPGNRPGGPNHPSRPSNPTPPPSRPHSGYNHGGGPRNPFVPAPRPFYRPTPPPPTWRPAPGWTPFTSILGIALGSAINYTLNTLINSGYTVQSYDNNVIQLSNVNMAGYFWPYATMYFNNYGQLYASRFIYAQSWADTSRYNTVYTTLTASYGAPVSVNNNGSTIEATWWGTNNQFIRLSYGPEYVSGGSLQYLTTLSYGN